MTQAREKTQAALIWISRMAGNKKWYIGVLLLVQIILGISSICYAAILRNIIDTAAAKNISVLFWWITVFAGLVIIQILLRAVNRFMEEYSRSTMENRLKERLLSFLLSKDYGRITAVHTGEWMNRLTSDTVVVADGISQIIPGAAGMLVKLAGALIMILILEPRFGYLLIPGGIFLIILTYIFRKFLKELHKRVQEADGSLRVFLQESLRSMLVVRAFEKETHTLSKAGDKMLVHKNARMKKNYFSNFCNIGFGAVMQGAYVIGAGGCGYGILTGTMSYGTLIAILQLISQIQSPFANITGYLPRYYAMLASAERLMEAETYKDDENFMKQEGLETMAEVHKFYENQFAGISLKQVGFTYQPPVKDSKVVMPVVLRNININIQKGEYIAFTGPSGCGKSTILKLMMNLYPVDNGECRIDIRYADEKFSNESIPLTAEYRSLFAYVPQGNHLMSGSIREIVAFSDQVSMQDEERIWYSLTIACAAEFVKEFALGIDTVLGEHGTGLSEGQMQRIAIARAIFSKHPVLLLDESTSALDEKTEKELLRNLRSLTDKTVVIVTHRLAVLDNCDKEICFSDTGVTTRNSGGRYGD